VSLMISVVQSVIVC